MELAPLEFFLGALAGHPLSLVNLLLRHSLRQRVTTRAAAVVSLRSRKTQTGMRLYVVPQYVLAIGIHEPEIVLSSLAAELLPYQPFADLAHCQRRFDAWRHVYNSERPHEALNLDVPITRFRLSPRPFPDSLAPVEYDSADIVRRVDAAGRIYFRNRKFPIGKAFRSHPVALRPAIRDGCFNVFFAEHHVATIDLNEAT